MSRGQEKFVSILGLKLSESKAQQNYGDKTLQTRVPLVAERGPTENKTLHSRFSVTSFAQAGLLHNRILGVVCVQFD